MHVQEILDRLSWGGGGETVQARQGEGHWGGDAKQLLRSGPGPPMQCLYWNHQP